MLLNDDVVDIVRRDEVCYPTVFVIEFLGQLLQSSIISLFLQMVLYHILDTN